MAEVESILHKGVCESRFPGAVAQWRRGKEVCRAKAGALATHGDDGNPLPDEKREPTDYDVLYDLASLTKLYSAITLLSLVDDGVLSLYDPIAQYLPSFRTDPGRRRVNLLHLLTHTSGLPSTWTGWAQDPGAQRSRMDVLAEICALPLEHAPGEHHEYSCVGYVAAMAAAEAATGLGWETLVEGKVLHQLGLRDTGFNPRMGRFAPTEYQPELGRGMVRGVVHDEMAWALGGVSANAGIFATLSDVSTFAAALSGGLMSVLSRQSFELMWNDQLPVVMGDRAGQAAEELGYRQGACLRIGDPAATGPTGGSLRGITGFTGTSMVVDGAGGYAVLLSNRVHPTRNGPEIAPIRAAFAEAAALTPAALGAS
ncbi:MAG: serine hydrolase domain-containing protein [Propionibacterium sp.]